MLLEFFYTSSIHHTHIYSNSEKQNIASYIVKLSIIFINQMGLLIEYVNL